MRDWKAEIRQRLAASKLPAAREAEIVEELSQHLEDRYQQLVAGGTAEEEASHAVMLELADSDLMTKEMRRVHRPIQYEPVVL